MRLPAFDEQFKMYSARKKVVFGRKFVSTKTIKFVFNCRQKTISTSQCLKKYLATNVKLQRKGVAFVSYLNIRKLKSEAGWSVSGSKFSGSATHDLQ